MTIPKVSIVMPIFNAAAYIEKSVTSLFEQSLNEIEYIFVDDCSKDDSIFIIKELLAKYPSRKDQCVFLKTPHNSGQGLARNIGMKAATGEYLIHCDSDDWTELDMYETMYNTAKEGNYDIVVCDYVSEAIGSNKLHRINYSSNNPQEIIRDSYRFGFHGVLWNKLIRRSIIVENNIYPYDGINIGEDFAIIIRAFVHANTLYKIDKPFYHYNVANVNSTTNKFKFTDKVCEQSIRKAELLKQDFEKMPRYEEYKKFIMCHCYRSKLHIIRDSFSDIKWFNKVFIDSDPYARHISLKSLSKPNAIRLFLVRNKLAFVQIIVFRLFKKLQKR